MARNGTWLLVWMCVVTAAAEQPRCPSGTSPDQCSEEGNASDEYFFTVRGERLIVTYEKKLHYTCKRNVSLEDEALPRFRRAIEVQSVTLTACAPPAAGYAAALRALNVSVRARLRLERLPARPALRAAHLRGLALARLELAAAEPQPLDPAVAAPLAALAVLQLDGLALPRLADLRAPPALRALRVVGAGLAGLPADALLRLPALEALEVEDALLVEADLSEARALRSVRLRGPLDGVTLGPAVVNVTLRDVRDAALRGNCSAVRLVSVSNASRPLPPDWLAACPAVSELRVWCMRRGLVGERALRGAGALRELELRGCELSALPPAWLSAAPGLRRLDLGSNRLEGLPSELADAAALKEVDLSNNRLRRDAVVTLASLPALDSLALDRNPLGDLCGSSGVYVTNSALSPLWKTRTLRTLRLVSTGLTHLCRDWRTELVQLTQLDLRLNGVELLEFDDLQWQRENATSVDLSRNPVRDVYYSPAQFAAVLAGNASEVFASSPMTTLELDGELRCDCTAYWYARAIRERPQHARAALKGARCPGGAALDAVAPRALLCALPAAQGCPAGCACLVGGERAELRCAGAGLRAVPRAPRLPARALLLARNNISRLAPADLAPELEVLDLSDNQIASVDAATTAALFGARRTVRLAGNPLRCDCDALPLLRALATHAASVPDAANVTCAAGGSALEAGRRLAARCAPGAWPYALAALALAAASAAVAGYLARPAARQRLKRFLFERGLCLRWLLRPLREHDDGEERPFDGFVSYSHLDARFADELARRLERGAGLRLCLHDRDWAPGEWIPRQIAQSVRRSRRTLVLLSESFLASTWARAELREAYAAALREQRPRLLLLLLPGLAPERAAAADPDLRAYLARVTYLRWDDPRFWDKLLLAMPRPRPAPSPGPAPAGAAPALPAPGAHRPPPPPV